MTVPRELNHLLSGYKTATIFKISSMLSKGEKRRGEEEGRLVIIGVADDT